MTRHDPSTTDHAAASTTVDRSDAKVLSMILGVAALLILLQGLWAGVFMNASGSSHHTWVEIHGHSGEALALVGVFAFVWAVLKMRARHDVLIGTAILAVALIVEVLVGMAGGGGLVVHIPLALIAMSITVWLPTRLR